MSYGVALFALLAAGACRPTVPFRLEADRGAVGQRTQLRLVGEPGARINARLKPALELEGGTVLRFDSPHLTTDSAYYVDAPTLLGALPEEVHRGVVRASVCPDDENICRSFTLAVRF